MYTEPKIEDRPAQPYMGIRTQVTMQEMGTGIIPELHDAVFAWLRAHDIPPVGAPFIRYHVINMAGKLDIEMGVPVGQGASSDGRILAGNLPAGRYAALIYTGIDNGVEGNRRLLEWGAKMGVVWDTYDSDHGDGFGARYESFLTEPDDEPDMAKWETEVAIRLKD